MNRPVRYAIGVVVAVVVATFLALDHLLADLTGWSRPVDQAIEAAGMATVVAVLLWAIVIKPLRAAAAEERGVAVDREEQLRHESARQEFSARLHRALEMTESEKGVYSAIRRALEHRLPDASAELLLADSSDAHLKQAVVAGAKPSGPGCTVGAPHSCPAIRRAQTLRFDAPDAFDACPHLEGRASGCAAICVPVSVAGRSIGVLHATTPAEAPATAADVDSLEAVADQGGGRIGMLRVMEKTHLQAATDPLTGLLNRRSFENAAQQLLRSDRPVVLAMGDLDHFKRLNDTFGHDAGDRALRLFSRVLRSALRSEDLVCRFGGEEFVVALPDVSVDQAAAALQRVQEELLVALAGGTVPDFTVSFGVADSLELPELQELCKVADAALFRAKREGRNRVVVDRLELHNLDA